MDQFLRFASCIGALFAGTGVAMGQNLSTRVEIKTLNQTQTINGCGNMIGAVTAPLTIIQQNCSELSLSASKQLSRLNTKVDNLSRRVGPETLADSRSNVEVLLARGSIDLALEMAIRVAEHTAEDRAEAYLEVAYLFAGQGRYPQSLAYAERAQNLKPGDAQLVFEHAMLIKAYRDALLVRIGQLGEIAEEAMVTARAIGRKVRDLKLKRKYPDAPPIPHRPRPDWSSDSPELERAWTDSSRQVEVLLAVQKSTLQSIDEQTEAFVAVLVQVAEQFRVFANMDIHQEVRLVLAELAIIDALGEKSKGHAEILLSDLERRLPRVVAHLERQSPGVDLLLPMALCGIKEQVRNEPPVRCRMLIYERAVTHLRSPSSRHAHKPVADALLSLFWSRELFEEGQTHDALLKAQVATEQLRKLSSNGQPLALPRGLNFGDNRFWLSTALELLARIHDKLGNAALSAKFRREAIERLERIAVGDLAAAWPHLGSIYQARGDDLAGSNSISEALAAYEQAITVYSRAYKSVRPRTRHLLEVFAFTYLKQFDIAPVSTKRCALLLKSWDVGANAYATPIRLRAREAVDANLCPRETLLPVLESADR